MTGPEGNSKMYLKKKTSIAQNNYKLFLLYKCKHLLSGVLKKEKLTMVICSLQ